MASKIVYLGPLKSSGSRGNSARRRHGSDDGQIDQGINQKGAAAQPRGIHQRSLQPVRHFAADHLFPEVRAARIWQVRQCKQRLWKSRLYTGRDVQSALGIVVALFAPVTERHRYVLAAATGGLATRQPRG